MQHGVERTVGPGRERVDARGELLQLALVGGGRDRREQDGRLDFERLADDEVTADILVGRNPDARAGARAALEQPFDLEPQQRFGDRQEAHAELRRQLAARNRLSEPELAAQDPLADDVVRFGGETGCCGEIFHGRPSVVRRDPCAAAMANRASRYGSFTARHSLLKIIVARVSAVNGSHFGSPL